MADLRNFAKIDLGYFDNPKINDFVDDRPRVPILHLRAILYCRQHLTDGTFPIRAVTRLACAKYCGGQCSEHCLEQCDLCAGVHAGLFVRVDDRTARVHDYLEHQDSAEQAAARKTRSEKAAAARWAKESNAAGNATSIAPSIPPSTAGSNAEKRREEKSKEPSSSAEDGQPEKKQRTKNTYTAEFEQWWASYPYRKGSKFNASTEFAKAIRLTDLETLIAAARAYSGSGVEEKFTLHTERWLKARRWEDAEVTPLFGPSGQPDPRKVIDGPPMPSPRGLLG